MYEITQWNGKQELAELDNTTISIDPILLNDAILKLMNEDTTIEDDVIDIDFHFGVKKADRYDYCFALFSGILSSLISKYVKMSGDIDLENIDFAQFMHLVKDINIKVQEHNEKTASDIEKTLNNVEEIIKDAHSYKNLAVDFASDFSMMGLVSSIVEKVFGIPGLGTLLITAIQSNDYNVTIACAFVYSLMYIVAIFVVDVLYGVIDPRIRVAKEGGK